jgi:hypothetical protein
MWQTIDWHLWFFWTWRGLFSFPRNVNRRHEIERIAWNPKTQKQKDTSAGVQNGSNDMGSFACCWEQLDTIVLVSDPQLFVVSAEQACPTSFTWIRTEVRMKGGTHVCLFYWKACESSFFAFILDIWKKFILLNRNEALWLIHLQHTRFFLASAAACFSSNLCLVKAIFFTIFACAWARIFSSRAWK